MTFRFQIPRTNQPELTFTLGPGDVLYMLGANGSGKSSLIWQLFISHKASAKRISAHRQTWFDTDSLEMSAAHRERVEQNILTQDSQDQSRYRLQSGGERTSMAVFDLINTETMLASKIADLVRAGDVVGAVKEGKSPAPIQTINELMGLSNIPIEISLERGQRIIARKNSGSGYSVAQLSDGERNALLIAADVLTAKPSTLLLIDEPERHLHRSIISPLLKLLFDKRKDCTFVVSTHEMMLPLDTPKAFTLLLRACEYAGVRVNRWTVDLIEPGAPLDEGSKSDLLGSRRKIIFVEGTAKSSLDAPLYSLLFPLVSVIPKDGCRNVEHAVRGLRSVEGMHWVAAWGIVDNDQRPPEDIARLRAAGVWALPHYSVESLYYHPTIIARVAEKQAALIGQNAAELVKAALAAGVGATKSQKDHLVRSAVLRSARNKVLNGLPTRADVEAGSIINVQVDVPTLRVAEEARFDKLIAMADWDGLLTRYPLRESSAFDRVADALKVADKATYREIVLKLLQDEQGAVSELRNLLDGLYVDVIK